MQLLYRRTKSASERPETTVFQDEVVKLIRALGLHVLDRTPCGQPISVAEAQAVFELSHHPNISQNGLANKLRLEKSTVSRLASMLEKRGWLERTRDKTDARILRLRLSSLGRRTAQRLIASREAKFKRVFEAIPDGKRAAVLHSLALVSEALDET